MPTKVVVPAANEYMQALQNPSVCFTDQTLRQGTSVRDRLGMPLVMSGNFAYVFKLDVGSKARAIKCFRQFLGDRESRYVAIEEHLDKHPIPDLADFEYDAAGVLVGGCRYPILIMEWVDGNTLDVYVDTLVKQHRAKGNLKTLAEQFGVVVSKLEEAEVAHGDLQHGNVIVMPTGELKLVDLDGMYVPSLSGRQATELGHSHFQHPKRTQTLWDQRLDHFSSLVIYTSLLALDHDPSLWIEFHDDNLIFVAGDFADPSRSKLFRRLKDQGGDVARLADVLATACVGDVRATPQLSSLVKVKASKLPGWMRAADVVTVQTKTREAAQPPPTIQPPPAPSTRTGQAQTAGAAVATPPHLTAVVPKSHAWIGEGLALGIGVGIGGSVFGLPIILRAIVELIGVQSPAVTAGTLYVVGSLAFGLWRQYSENRTASQTASTPITRSPPPIVPVSRPQPTGTTFTPGTGRQPTRVVASKTRMLYHLPTCEWASRIGGRNRQSFTSPQEAQMRGYRACKVCKP